MELPRGWGSPRRQWSQTPRAEPPGIHGSFLGSAWTAGGGQRGRGVGLETPRLGWARGSCSPSWWHRGAVGRVQVGWLPRGDVCSSPVISQVPRGRKPAAGLLCLRIRALAPSPQPVEVALGAGLQGRGRGRLCPHVGATPPAPSGSGSAARLVPGAPRAHCCHGLALVDFKHFFNYFFFYLVSIPGWRGWIPWGALAAGVAVPRCAAPRRQAAKSKCLQPGLEGAKPNWSSLLLNHLKAEESPWVLPLLSSPCRCAVCPPAPALARSPAIGRCSEEPNRGGWAGM